MTNPAHTRMDRRTLEVEDIPARYLSGDLTVREAREFEKFCLANPDVVETLPIPIRLKARLARRRLTEEEADQVLAPTPAPNLGVEQPVPAPPRAAEPELLIDDEPPPRFTVRLDRPLVLYALIAAVLVAVAAAVSFALQAHDAKDSLRRFEQEVRTLSLRAPSSLESYRLKPDRSGPPGDAQLSMRWPDPPQLLELRIDVGEGRYTAFAVTIDKVGEARIMQLRRLAPDTNRQLRLALNSSAFGPGEYLLHIEGYTWRGELVDYGWIRLQLIH
jgi:hypothetical protein